MNRKSNRSERLKWYHVYYILAIFNVLILALCLLPLYSLLSTYTQSGSDAFVLSERSNHLSKLTELAVSVRTPGNAAFFSGNVEEERLRLARSYSRFQLAIQAARKDVKRYDQGDKASRMLRSIDAIANRVGMMQNKTLAVFTALKNDKQDRARALLFEVDQYFARALSAAGQVRLDVQLRQTEQFSSHNTRAYWYSWIDVAIGASVSIILGIITWWGHGVARLMRHGHLLVQTSETNMVAVEGAADVAAAAKNDFLSNMGHDIRTPITNILGNAEVLLGTIDDPQSGGIAKAIHKSAEQLLLIVNGIVDVAKIESDSLEINLQSCSPADILGELTDELSPQAQAKNLPLIVEYNSSIPEHIQSDPVRLRQILSTLIRNAIETTKIGEIRVQVRLVTANPDEPKLRFDVVDMGIGLTEQQVGNFFQPFSPDDVPSIDLHGQAELDLAISKYLSVMLGGDIQINSESRAGNNFSVTIATGPLTDATMLDLITPEAFRDLEERPDRLPIQLDCRVLLAEDGPNNQRLNSFVLRKAGAEVTVAEDGQIALDLALASWEAGSPFDVILMDIHMPVMDGFEATRKLREAGYSNSIVALTANDEDDARQKCLDAGCDEYASKPITREVLVHLVAHYASQSNPMVVKE